MKVLVTANPFDIDGSAPLQQLRGHGVEVVARPVSDLSSFDLGPDVVGMVTGGDPITADLLSMVPNLRVISRCSIDQSIMERAFGARPDVLVVDAKYSTVDAQAELVFGLVISLLREIVPKDRLVRKGEWNAPDGDQLSANTVGIIGCDPVGMRVGEMAAAFGAKVVAWDPSTGTYPSAMSMVSLNELLHSATIVTLHNNNDGTGHCVLSSAHLAMLPQGSLLINCSNPGAVSEDDLAECLISGRLRGAAVDTFVEQPYVGRLRGLDNVVLTPSIARRTREAQKQMEDAAALGLVDGLRKVGVLA